MGANKHDGLAIPGQVVLAREPRFTLGRVKVRPELREVVSGARREILEPRVMQVLVALARADGEIVTRDELIEYCWSGRIVSDDAINRALSRIRQVAHDLGRDSFRVETITKVGYRLSVLEAPALVSDALAPTAAEAEILSKPRGVDRRAVLAGGLAAAIAGATAVYFATKGPAARPQEAELLLQRSVAIFQSGRPEDYTQAIAYMTEATRLAPDDAELWGALALAHAGEFFVVPKAEQQAHLVRARAAIDRAFALDPQDLRAARAVFMTTPFYGRWAELDRMSVRTLAKHPDHPMALITRANMLTETGRWRQAERVLSRLEQKLRYQSPALACEVVMARWGAGMLPEADSSLEQAEKLWPRERIVWEAQIAFLAFTGRATEALRLIDDPSAKPFPYPDDAIAPARAFVVAKISSDPADILRARKQNLVWIEAHPQQIPVAMRRLASLGDRQTAALLIAAAYMREGPFAEIAARIDPTETSTTALFEPSMAPMWRDPVFAAALRHVGLEDFWASAGVQPDFRSA